MVLLQWRPAETTEAAGRAPASSKTSAAVSRGPHRNVEARPLSLGRNSSQPSMLATTRLCPAPASRSCKNEKRHPGEVSCSVSEVVPRWIIRRKAETCPRLQFRVRLRFHLTSTRIRLDRILLSPNVSRLDSELGWELLPARNLRVNTVVLHARPPPAW